MVRAWAVVKVAVISLGLVSCVDNDTSVFIRQVAAPQGGDCTYGSSAAGRALSSGTLDLAFVSSYRAGLVVGSQLASRASAEEMKTESARFRATEADVSVESGDGKVIGQFSIPVNGIVDPGQGGTVSYGVVETILIDDKTGNSLRARFAGGQRTGEKVPVVVSVKIKGETLGGRELSTGDFRFPINVCYGCLVVFPAEATLKTEPVPNCANMEQASELAMPCIVGQDDMVDCRICQMRGVSSTVCNP